MFDQLVEPASAKDLSKAAEFFTELKKEAGDMGAIKTFFHNLTGAGVRDAKATVTTAKSLENTLLNRLTNIQAKMERFNTKFDPSKMPGKQRKLVEQLSKAETQADYLPFSKEPEMKKALEDLTKLKTDQIGKILKFRKKVGDLEQPALKEAYEEAVKGSAQAAEGLTAAEKARKSAVTKAGVGVAATGAAGGGLAMMLRNKSKAKGLDKKANIRSAARDIVRRLVGTNKLPTLVKGVSKAV